MSNSEFYYKGYKLTLENSITIQKSAKACARNKNYGVACSLNILAAEEAIKSSFILLKYLFPETEIMYFKEVFRKHSVKHEHIKSFLNVYDIHVNQLKDFIKLVELAEKLIKLFDDKPTQERRLEPFAESINTKNNLKKYLKRKVNIETISSWIQNANTDKNNGFYVELINDKKWLSPNLFSREKYMLESKYTNEVINFAIEFEKVVTNKIIRENLR